MDKDYFKLLIASLEHNINNNNTVVSCYLVNVIKEHVDLLVKSSEKVSDLIEFSDLTISTRAFEDGKQEEIDLAINKFKDSLLPFTENLVDN
jgi:hypothetical protein